MLTTEPPGRARVDRHIQQAQKLLQDIKSFLGSLLHIGNDALYTCNDTIKDILQQESLCTQLHKCHFTDMVFVSKQVVNVVGKKKNAHVFFSSSVAHANANVKNFAAFLFLIKHEASTQVSNKSKGGIIV